MSDTEQRVPGLESSARSAWRDEPIERADQDALGRTKFAQHAAGLIGRNHMSSSSVVYGLEGPWGSGKSSAIALTTTYLTSGESPWEIVRFTPWATSGTDALFEEFFSALSTAIPSTEAARRIRHRLTSYAQIARPVIASVPVVGSGLAEASRSLETTLRKPWNEAFTEAADELQRLGTPILVVVDDIDRLQPEELLDLLKVVRLVGRFPGVDYLLAYDEKTLVETLQHPSRGEVSSARARMFMEKIVQYPLSMPPLLRQKIVKMLNDGLTRIVTPQRVDSSFDKSRFGPVILEAMPSQLTTPRAIERFLAQVEEQFRIHDLDEVNDVDLIIAAFIRVQFPDLFAGIQRWKQQLTRVRDSWTGPTLRADEPTDWTEMFDLIEDAEGRADARIAMAAAFPAVADRSPARAAPRRMAHPDYFDRYLAQAVPEGDIPESEITRALFAAARGDGSALRGLLIESDDDRTQLALQKVRARYSDVTRQWMRTGAGEAPVTVELLDVVMGILNDMRERTSGWTTDVSQAEYWAASLTRLVLSEESGADVASAFASCKNVDRRAQVLASCLPRLDELEETTKKAIEKLLRHEAGLILDLLIADLKERDYPTGVTGNGFLFDLVKTGGLLSEAQSAVRQGLDQGDFEIADVAARFVGLMYTVGLEKSAPSAVSFNGRAFTELTGVDADSVDHAERGEWTDASWSRRRAFAMEHVHLGDTDSIQAVEGATPAPDPSPATDVPE